MPSNSEIRDREMVSGAKGKPPKPPPSPPGRQATLSIRTVKPAGMLATVSIFVDGVKVGIDAMDLAVDPGTYVVSWEDINPTRFIAPAAQTITLAAKETKTVTGTFTALVVAPTPPPGAVAPPSPKPILSTPAVSVAPPTPPPVPAPAASASKAAEEPSGVLLSAVGHLRLRVSTLGR